MYTHQLFFYIAFAIFCFIAGHLVWQQVRDDERVHYDDIPKKYLLMYLLILSVFCGILQYQYEIVQEKTIALPLGMLAVSIFIGLVASDAFNMLQENTVQTTEENEETIIAQN